MSYHTYPPPPPPPPPGPTPPGPIPPGPIPPGPGGGSVATLLIKPPFQVFTDLNGQPLENGYIFIGQANLNPQTNPISVYFNAGLTLLAAQPIRTIGGYPANAGTPGRLFVNQDYSIQVQNRNGSLVYTSLNSNAFPGSAGNLFVNGTGNGVQTVFPVPFAPGLIYINGVYQNQSSYTIAGGNVTFSQAPPLTSVIEFLF